MRATANEPEQADLAQAVNTPPDAGGVVPATPVQADGQLTLDAQRIVDALRTEIGSDDRLQALIENALTGGQPLFRTDRVLESLRFAEYDISAGIGEFVDNAIEAKAPNIRVIVKAVKGKQKGKEVVGEMAIVDDGVGMGPQLLRKSLVLGESERPPSADGKMGIGRFGVGMTMGGISLAKRIDVFSRSSPDAPFYHTYVDLDEVSAGTQKVIPEPEEATPPAEYAALLEKSTGTIVVLTKCDRLQHAVGDEGKEVRASDVIADLPIYLGRTFRKFIHGGTNIFFDRGDGAEKVYLHDPLYLLGPTKSDAQNPDGRPDPKATQIGETVNIDLPVPGKDGETAAVTVKVSLLPKEWRMKPGDGGNEFARRRRVHENEGISVLRANREVLYGWVPYIFGARGQFKGERPDRFWGLEISFPPELDSFFHVRFIKRGAEPIKALRDKIQAEVGASLKGLRERIQKEWSQNDEQKETEVGVFREAEETMAKAEEKLPGGKRGSKVTPEETEKVLERIAAESEEGKYGGGKAKTKEERKEEIAAKPYSIVPVSYPASVFFEPEFLPGRIIVKLNVNHPFYRDVFEPLCGPVESVAEGEEADAMAGATTDQQRLARRAFLLLLLSYAKAESFFSDETVFNSLRAHWGTTLGSALTD